MSNTWFSCWEVKMESSLLKYCLITDATPQTGRDSHLLPEAMKTLGQTFGTTQNVACSALTGKTWTKLSSMAMRTTLTTKASKFFFFLATTSTHSLTTILMISAVNASMINKRNWSTSVLSTSCPTTQSSFSSKTSLAKSPSSSSRRSTISRLMRKSLIGSI